MKICSKCKLEKNDSAFSKKSNRGLQCMCKSCTNIYNKAHYHSNKAKYQARVKIHKQCIVKFIRDYKAVTPCLDCKQQYHYSVMEFDHLYDKRFMLAHAAGGSYSIETVQKEISKCELVCANCHRLRTFKRRGLGSSKPLASKAMN